MLPGEGIRHKIYATLNMTYIGGPIAYFHKITLSDWVIFLALLAFEGTNYGQVVGPDLPSMSCMKWQMDSLMARSSLLKVLQACCNGF